MKYSYTNYGNIVYFNSLIDYDHQDCCHETLKYKLGDLTTSYDKLI